jgi:hypothetical protein
VARSVSSVIWGGRHRPFPGPRTSRLCFAVTDVKSNSNALIDDIFGVVVPGDTRSVSNTRQTTLPWLQDPGGTTRALGRGSFVLSRLGPSRPSRRHLAMMTLVTTVTSLGTRLLSGRLSRLC